MDSKYKYSYESSPDYCYENSNVLINKENIKDEALLEKFERQLVALNQLQLYFFQSIYNKSNNCKYFFIYKKAFFFPYSSNKYSLHRSSLIGIG